MGKRVLVRVPGDEELCGVTIYRDGTYRLHTYLSDKLSKDEQSTGKWEIDTENKCIHATTKSDPEGSKWSAEEGDKSFEMVVEALLSLEIEKILE